MRHHSKESIGESNQGPKSFTFGLHTFRMRLHRNLKMCLGRLKACSSPPEIRRSAERQLSNLLLQLVDAKIRHGLSHSDELWQLADTVLDPAMALEGTGAILLDHFRYRLAHVAMRSRQWSLAQQLLDTVLQGRGELRLARIYQAFCRSKLGQLHLDDMALVSLVHDLVAAEQPSGPVPLDLAVQDPVTNMAELFLLLQDAPEHVLDGLYDSAQGDPLKRGLTAGLTVLLVPQEGEHSELIMGEWLALRQVRELEEEGWLVVDNTFPLGELGRNSPVEHPDGKLGRAFMRAGLQVLAKEAPAPMDRKTVHERFFDGAGPGLIGVPGGKGRQKDRGKDSPNPVDLDRVPAAILSRNGKEVVDHCDGCWKLRPPYAVISRDARRDWHQLLPSSQ